jgi:predicted methyltransferase
VSAPDRTPDDRALDAGRKPAELLAFAGIRPGMRVAELGAGGGYTTELLARAVGPTGTVYAQNNRLILDRFAEKPWSARLTRPVMANVVRVDREFDDPLPPAASNLDAVVIILFYHDLFWMGAVRPSRLPERAADHRPARGGARLSANAETRCAVHVPRDALCGAVEWNHRRAVCDLRADAGDALGGADRR